MGAELHIPPGKNGETAPPGFGGTDLLVVTAACWWGLNVPLIKLALLEFSPLAFNGVRFVLAPVVSYGLLVAVQRGRYLDRRDLPLLTLLGVLAHGVYQIMFILGTNLTTGANTALLLATIPVHVAWIALLTRTEGPNWRVYGGIALSLTGMATVMGASSSLSLAARNLPGDLLILLGTVAMGIYTVMARRLMDRYTPLQYSTYTMVLGTPVLVAAAAADLWHQDWSLTPRAWGIAAYSGILAISVAYYFWTWGVHRIGSTRTAVYQNLVPVVGVGLSALLLGESIRPGQVLGGVLIITGILVARLPGRWDRPATAGVGDC